MRDSRLRRLLDGVTSVAQDLSLHDVLYRIVRAACDLVDCRYGALGVLGPDGTLGEFVHTGLDSDAHERIGRLPSWEGLLGMLAEQQRPVRLDDLRRHPRAAGFPGRHPAMTSFLGVPIQVRDTMFGLLYLCEKRGGADFTKQDEEGVVALAAAAGVAIESASRYETTRRRERWLEASQDVTSALLAGESPADVLSMIAERARAVADASVGAVAVPSEDRSALVFDVVEPAGEDSARLTGLSVPADESTATGLAFIAGRPVAVRQYGEHVAAQQAGADVPLPAMVKDLDSAVAVPLVAGETVLGVLMVAKFTDSGPFTDDDRNLVETFAGHAAMALEFARAEEDRRRLAVFADRDRIARDLHDLIIQRLFAVGLSLEGISRTARQPELATRLSGLTREIDRTIRDLRTSIFSLQEPNSDSLRSQLLGLVVDAAGAAGFEPRISFDGPLDTVVSETLRPDLVAALREALSNAARHAAATSVSVDVVTDRQGRRLTLTVSDNGVGIPPEATRRSGLANLQRRAERWDGALAVRAGAAGGTVLEWTVALTTDREDRG